jgi:orotate phosphoribosyltransferase
MTLQAYQREFIRFAIDCGALSFGRFTLKSGRQSPYFFNTGKFDSGARLSKLGRYYALALQGSGLEFDMVFGPAYKGIPLAAAVTIGLYEHCGRDLPWSANRKELKDHGEGGLILGAPLQGRVVIVDDVISAGTSVKQSVAIIRAAGAVPVGVAIALDRQERGGDERSAVAMVRETYGLTVVSIVTLRALCEYLRGLPGENQHLQAIESYMAQYGSE